MSESPPYTIVVGLEVHVQLLTRTKLFCRCSTQFGNPPNTQTCPVCLGLPGALPVMNRRALELAMRTAAALNCDIPLFTKWDRKNYFYPDLPKGYQISQFDLPLSAHGWLLIDGEAGPRRIRILRAHLEEDAGKSMHDEQAGVADSRIDLNRTGTPLLEIVSQPDIRSPGEAKSYLTELKLLLGYLGVSDCNMQEGSLRVDANVNLHIPQGDVTVETPIVEIKNVNSFRAVERAIAYEAERQYRLWRQDGKSRRDAPKQTRGWDDQEEITKPQREKEESSDYRYFPDPDLPPVTLTPEEIDAVRRSLGELPAALRTRLREQYELDAYSVDVLVSQGRGVADYFERLARSSQDARRANNWVQQEVLRVLGERNWSIEQFPLPPERLGDLLRAIHQGELDNTRAKDVFQRMLESNVEVRQAMQELGVERLDADALSDLCERLLRDNPKVVEDVRGGKQQALGALIGQAKKLQPNINPGELRRLLLEKIDAS